LSGEGFWVKFLQITKKKKLNITFARSAKNDSNLNLLTVSQENPGLPLPQLLNLLTVSQPGKPWTPVAPTFESADSQPGKPWTPVAPTFESADRIC
jgi:hypothetical protein